MREGETGHATDRRRGAGRDGDGRPAIHRATRQPPVVPPDLGRRQRAVRRAGVPHGSPLASSGVYSCRHRRSGRPGGAPGRRESARAAVLGDGRLGRGRNRGSLRQGRPLRRQQRTQPPHVARRPAARPRDQQRPPRPHRRAAQGARLERRARHEPELLDRHPLDGACAAAPVRPQVGRRHHAPGPLRRRLSRRRLARRRRQRRPVHLG